MAKERDTQEPLVFKNDLIVAIVQDLCRWRAVLDGQSLDKESRERITQCLSRLSKTPQQGLPPLHCKDLPLHFDHYPQSKTVELLNNYRISKKIYQDSFNVEFRITKGGLFTNDRELETAECGFEQQTLSQNLGNFLFSYQEVTREQLNEKTETVDSPTLDDDIIEIPTNHQGTLRNKPKTNILESLNGLNISDSLKKRFLNSINN